MGPRCVCVCERERERERDNKSSLGQKSLGTEKDSILLCVDA